MQVKVTQLCPILCDPMDYTLHGILQARILEWVSYPFSSGSFQPRNQTRASCIAGGFFTNWAIRKALKYILFYNKLDWASPEAQQVKNLPPMQETQEMWIQSLGWEDPLEEGMATYSSILAWKIPWTEEPGGLWSMKSQRVGHDWSNWAHMHI